MHGASPLRGRRRARTHLIALACALSGGPALADSVDECIARSEDGQAARDDGKLSLAREAFTACGSSACPAEIRRACGAWLEQVDARQPSIVVVLRDGAEPPRDATYRIDGGPPTRADGRAVRVDVGSHVLVVDAPGHAPHTETFFAYEGDQLRQVPARVGPRDAPPVQRQATRPPAPGEDGAPQWPRIVGLSAAGLAVVAIGFGVASGVDALGARSDLAAACGNASACSGADVDRVEGKLLRTDVLLGVGVVAAAASVYFLLVHPKATRPPASVSGAGGSWSTTW